ncbi:hypothetical protein ACNR9V_03925 [Parageobacillus thermoglucosidasius]|uniref:hypothetical protein n=1 Tax=Parageobacillus thermoglucosidasius TaxID=1426 RepID=UPI003B672B7C
MTNVEKKEEQELLADTPPIHTPFCTESEKLCINFDYIKKYSMDRKNDCVFKNMTKTGEMQ